MRMPECGATAIAPAIAPAIARAIGPDTTAPAILVAGSVDAGDPGSSLEARPFTGYGSKLQWQRNGVRRYANFTFHRIVALMIDLLVFTSDAL